MNLLNKINSIEGKTNVAIIGLTYTLCNVLVKGIAIISTPIFSRLLSKTEFGLFSNFTAWENILYVLLTLDFSAAIMRAKYDFDGKIDQYIASLVLVGNFITSIFWIVVEINQSLWINILGMNIFYIRMICIYIMFFPVFSYFQTKYRMYNKCVLFVILTAISTIARISISVLLVCIMDDKLAGRTIGYVLPITILNFFLWITLIKHFKYFSFKYIKYACAISIPLIPHTLSGILLSGSDKIMITTICGPNENAIYSLGFEISMFASLIWMSMNQAWAPWLYDNIYESNFKKIQDVSKKYLLIYLSIISFFLLLVPEFVLLLGGLSYYECRTLVPPIILGCIFQFCYSMYVNLEIYDKKTITISIGTILAATINMLLNYTLIPLFGYKIAAYTTLLGYCLLFTFHYQIVKIYSNYLFGIYNNRFILKCLLLSTLFSFIILVIMDYRFIRISLAIVYFAIIFSYIAVNKNNIKKVLKSRI